MDGREHSFPEIDWVDRGFVGGYRIDGSTIVIFPDDSDLIIYGKLLLEFDDSGFLTRRRIDLPTTTFGAYEEHYERRIDP